MPSICVSPGVFVDKDTELIRDYGDQKVGGDPVDADLTDSPLSSLMGADYTSQTNQAPIARFRYSFASSRQAPNPAVGDEVTFDASSSTDPDGSIARYAWDINSPTFQTADRTGVTMTKSFTNSGDHAVTLQVTDDDGATSSTSQTVSVGDGSTTVTPSLSAFVRGAEKSSGTYSNPTSSTSTVSSGDTLEFAYCTDAYAACDDSGSCETIDGAQSVITVKLFDSAGNVVSDTDYGRVVAGEDDRTASSSGRVSVSISSGVSQAKVTAKPTVIIRGASNDPYASGAVGSSSVSCPAR